MANPNKGEVEFRSGDDTYKLRFTVNSICELEQTLGRGVIEMSMALARGEVTMTVVRALLWAGLQDKHPGVSLKDAGEMISGAGGLLPVYTIVAEAFALAFPPQQGQKSEIPTMEASSPKVNGTGLAS